MSHLLIVKHQKKISLYKEKGPIGIVAIDYGNESPLAQLSLMKEGSMIGVDLDQLDIDELIAVLTEARNTIHPF